MQCIVPSCYNDDGCCVSKGITFFKFPMQPTLCATWLKALNMEDLKSLETIVICSNHFIKNDMYINKNGQCNIHPDAVPMINIQNLSNNDCCMTACNVKVCRICFATDCNLYSMTMYNNLDQAYQTLTGLSIENEDNLPPYLCTECAYRLLNCVNFRTRTLGAHSILLEIIKRHDHITQESFKFKSGIQSLFGSNISVHHNPIDHYDLIIEHIKSKDTDNIETNQETDIINIINMPENSIPCEIKKENFDMLNTDNNDVADNGDSEYFCNSYTDIDSVKTESDNIFDKDELKDDIISIEIEHDDAGVDENYSTGDKQSSGDGEQETKYSVRIENVTNVLKNSNQLHICNVKLSCDLCSYQTSNELLLLKHLKAHFKAKILKCNICNYKTICKKNLKNHNTTHGDEKYSCKICNKILNRRASLIRHMKLHSVEKPYSCSICSKSFKRQDHCKSHMKTHSEDKPYSCDTCNKKFSRKDHYKSHLKLHSSEKRIFTCDICKTLFSRKSNLRNHMYLHSDKKLYSCATCNKTFNRKFNLQNHLKLHGMKPHLCDICKRCFRRRCELKNHVQISHTDDTTRQYTCYIYKKTFSSKHSFRKHLRKHAKE